MDTSDSISMPLYRRLREARRARGLTQCALAEQVGCRQSALSMLESGRMDAVTHATVVKIAKLLDVVLDPATKAIAPDQAVAPLTAGALCPSGDCPSNAPFAVNGEILFWPRHQPIADARHCVFCGEVLVRACRQCGAPIAEGACCARCGTAHVPPPAVEPADAAAWAERRRREIADWRDLQA